MIQYLNNKIWSLFGKKIKRKGRRASAKITQRTGIALADFFKIAKKHKANVPSLTWRNLSDLGVKHFGFWLVQLRIFRILEFASEDGTTGILIIFRFSRTFAIYLC